jgi:hypothetical protein
MLYGTPGARHHAERSQHLSHTVQQLHWKREPGLQSGLSGNRSRQRRSHLHLRIKLHPVSGRKCRLLAHCSTTEHGSNSAANERRIPDRHAPLLALCSVLLFVFAPRLRRISRLSPLLLAMFVVCVAGCGGGAASAGSGTTLPLSPAATGTTPGDCLITISSTNTGGVLE